MKQAVIAKKDTKENVRKITMIAMLSAVSFILASEKIKNPTLHIFPSAKTNIPKVAI